jgi:hypothetical protein
VLAAFVKGLGEMGFVEGQNISIESRYAQGDVARLLELAAELVRRRRCRPYRKNDQAYVEQKNGAVVRRLVGYRRLAGVAAARELARLYASARLFVNFFQPSFKLLEKRRDGALVRKRYHPPATPCQRLLADKRTTEEVRTTLEALQKQLDPVALLHEIRYRQRRWAAASARRRGLGGQDRPTGDGHAVERSTR